MFYSSLVINSLYASVPKDIRKELKYPEEYLYIREDQGNERLKKIQNNLRTIRKEEARNKNKKINFKKNKK